MPWSETLVNSTDVRWARTRLRIELRRNGVLEPSIFDSEIVFTELVSNALRYGAAEVALVWINNGAILHVRDSGPPFRLPKRSLEYLDSQSGRGLLLVQTLSRSLEVERTGSGNHVQAVLTARRGPSALWRGET